MSDGCVLNVNQGDSITSFIDNGDGTATAFVGSVAVGTVVLPPGATNHETLYSDLVATNTSSITPVVLNSYTLPAGSLIKNGDALVITSRMISGALSTVKVTVNGVDTANGIAAPINQTYKVFNYKLIRLDNNTCVLEYSIRSFDTVSTLFSEENYYEVTYLTGLDLTSNTLPIQVIATANAGVPAQSDCQYLTVEILRAA